MLGEIDLSHSTFAEPLQHVITLGEHASDERVARPLGSKRRTVIRAEARSRVVFDAALRAHLRDRHRFAFARRRLLREKARSENARAKRRRIGSRTALDPIVLSADAA